MDHNTKLMLELYKAPFQYTDGIVLDSTFFPVVTVPQESSLNEERDRIKLQNAVGQMVAEALNEFFNQNAGSS